MGFEPIEIEYDNVTNDEIYGKKRNPLPERVSEVSREDRIRTCDPYVPNVVRYRAALLPEKDKRVTKIKGFNNFAK